MRKQVESWHDVSDKEIDDFFKAVDKLRRDMLPVDCDGHYPVTFHITDRRKYETNHYFDVPYYHRNPPEKVWGVLISNLDRATDSVRLYLDLQRYEKENKEGSVDQR